MTHRLTLRREQLRVLNAPELSEVEGGFQSYDSCVRCPTNCCQYNTRSGAFVCTRPTSGGGHTQI